MLTPGICCFRLSNVPKSHYQWAKLCNSLSYYQPRSRAVPRRSHRPWATERRRPSCVALGGRRNWKAQRCGRTGVGRMWEPLLNFWVTLVPLLLAHSWWPWWAVCPWAFQRNLENHTLERFLPSANAAESSGVKTPYKKSLTEQELPDFGILTVLCH